MLHARPLRRGGGLDFAEALDQKSPKPTLQSSKPESLRFGFLDLNLPV